VTLDLVVAPAAEADIDGILEWSVSRFGPSVRDGYEALIDVAIEQLRLDPERLGSHPRTNLNGTIRGYHLAAAKDVVGDGVRRIDKPRHFVVYRVVGRELQIIRILHDALDFSAQRLR
jgi:toxin ParE1/3/4